MATRTIQINPSQIVRSLKPDLEGQVKTSRLQEDQAGLFRCFNGFMTELCDQLSNEAVNVEYEFPDEQPRDQHNAVGLVKITVSEGSPSF